MSASKENSGIKKAVEIIERFGGIRPMAKKMGVAVTTVQGWKKRDVIPAARRQQVLDAAAAHDIDLSDVLEGASVVLKGEPDDLDEQAVIVEASLAEAVEPADVEEVASVAAEVVDTSIDDIATDNVEILEEDSEAQQADGVDAESENGDETVDETGGAVDEPEDSVQQEAPVLRASDPLDRRLAATEKRAVAKSTWINLILLGLGLAAVVALLWPQQKKDDDARLSTLEQDVDDIQGDVEAVKSKQSFFGTLIPEDLGAQLSYLQEQAGVTQERIGQVLSRAQEVSDDVLGEDAGSLEARLAKLEGHMSDLAGSPVLAGFLDRIDVMDADEAGQLRLAQVMDELGGLVGTMSALGDGSGDDSIDAVQQDVIFGNMLLAARESSPAIGQTFSDLPATDLKAAALLLGMSQFRSTLNRDNEAFDSDLKVLLGLVGDEDAELRAALVRLAPHAQDGVLTPSGLTGEFKGIAGDAVVASLSGEDVSLQERTSARFNELFQVEKDGELVSGTETQGTLKQAENLLENGDLEGAIAVAQSLDGDAAEVVAPWIDKAEVTLLAQKVRRLLGNSMVLKAYGPVGEVVDDGGMALVPGAGRFIRDEATGITILRPTFSPKKALENANALGK